jgi:hypothetical protein
LIKSSYWRRVSAESSQRFTLKSLTLPREQNRALEGNRFKAYIKVSFVQGFIRPFGCEIPNIFYIFFFTVAVVLDY